MTNEQFLSNAVIWVLIAITAPWWAAWILKWICIAFTAPSKIDPTEREYQSVCAAYEALGTNLTLEQQTQKLMLKLQYEQNQNATNELREIANAVRSK